MKIIEKVLNDKVKFLLDQQSLFVDHEKNAQAFGLLRSYNKGFKDNFFTAEYKTSTELNDFGRLYPNNGNNVTGLSMFQKTIRAFLAKETYIDVDMKKAHWYIMKYLFQKYSFDYSLVSDIINDYDVILDWIRENLLTLNSSFDLKGEMFKLLYTQPSFVMSYNSKMMLEKIEHFKRLHEVIYGPFLSCMKINFADLYRIVCKKNKNPNNIDGSFISHVLQHHERLIILDVIDLLTNNGLVIGSVIHDGVLVEKSSLDFQLIFDDVRKKMNETRKGLDVILCIKEFPEYPPEWDNYSDVGKKKFDYIRDDYYWQDFLNDMDMVFGSLVDLTDAFGRHIKRCAVINHTIPNMICRKINRERLFQYDNISSIHTAFRFMKKIGKAEVETSISWKALLVYTVQLIPCYDNIIFHPLGVFEDEVPLHRELNTWSGFKAQLIPEEKINTELIEPILHHMKVVICDSKPDRFTYLLSWFRSIFLNPREKTKTAVMFNSPEKQTGKGMFTTFMLDHIFGKYGLKMVGLDNITCRFNDTLMDRLYVVCDELTNIQNSSAHDFHAVFNIMKNYITDIDGLNIEIKGGRKFAYPNYIGFNFNGNYGNAIKIEKDDPRYVIYEVNPIYKGNFEYFKKLKTSMTQETANHFFSYICYSPDTVDTRRIPQSDLRDQMIYSSLSSVDKFLIDVKEFVKQVWSKTIRTSQVNPEKWDGIIKFTFKDPTQCKIEYRNLYTTYKAWCSENLEKAKSQIIFSREMNLLTDHTRSGSTQHFIIKL